eukprot:TRINITY_DN202069_c1_g1_i1.p1 TRINITY_DN202069_c1_g1~~TRINITY_DN202069_c1_g1_i1.p1  ORF type:complete len:152 (-),score=5.46 TRINITY_DN202069_c1_g1_i1:31-462(-)
MFEPYIFTDYLYAFLLTLFAGLSTSIGAIIAFFSKKKSEILLSLGLGFSAGVMIYVSFMEILQKAEDAFLKYFPTGTMAQGLSVFCFFAGIALSAFIDKLIPEDVNPHEPKSYNELDELKENSKDKNITKLKEKKKTTRAIKY